MNKFVDIAMLIILISMIAAAIYVLAFFKGYEDAAYDAGIISELPMD